MGAEMVEESARFPPEFACVGEARRFVRRVLGDWGLDRIEERASLLVTELATNSVLHARTAFQVTVAFDGESLRLGVSDGSLRAPSAKTRSPQAPTGRGMSLIVAVADSWGVEPRPDGKTVWCVLARREWPKLGDTAVPEDTTGQVHDELPPGPGGSRYAGARACRQRLHSSAFWPAA